MWITARVSFRAWVVNIESLSRTLSILGQVQIVLAQERLHFMRLISSSQVVLQLLG